MPGVKETRQVYTCGVCGNVVEVLNAGGGELVCCKQPMDLQVENTTDAAKEKHVPVIEKNEGGYKVKIGAVAHPMEEKHYIQAIELVADGTSCLYLLKPGQVPEAVFTTGAEKVTVRALCNLHGLWKA